MNSSILQGAGDYTVSPADNARQPLVSLAIDDANNSTETLSQALDVLEARLTPILSNPVQSAGASAPKPPLPSVPSLVEGIQGLTRRVRGAEVKIREIINRLEV